MLVSGRNQTQLVTAPLLQILMSTSMRILKLWLMIKAIEPRLLVLLSLVSSLLCIFDFAFNCSTRLVGGVDEILLGEAAINQAASNPENTIFNIKRILGRKSVFFFKIIIDDLFICLEGRGALLTG